MSHSTKQNASNLFVKECITTSLFDLLQKKSLNEISVTEIINHAGVSRMGFYRNFSSKEEVIEKYILDCFVTTIQAIEENRPLRFNTKSILITTLKYFKKYSDYLKILLKQKLEHLMYNCYVKAFFTLYNTKLNSALRDYWVHMFIGELFNLEITWLRHDMKESPEQMADIYYRLTKLKADALDKYANPSSFFKNKK